MLVVLISLISRGRLRWSLVVLVASYVAVMYVSYLSAFGYGFFACIFLIVAWITGSVRAQRRQREVTLVSLAELNEDQLRSREEHARLEERARLAGGTFTVLDDASTFTWVLELPEEASAQ